MLTNASYTKRLNFIGLVALVALGVSWVVFAQSGSCPESDCQTYSDFSTDADGWTAFDGDTHVDWLDSHRFGFWGEYKVGVVKVYGGYAHVQKTIWLEPGEYVIKAIGGADTFLNFPLYLNATVSINEMDLGIGFGEWRGNYATHTSEIFYVLNPGNVNIDIHTLGGGTYYLDSVWVVPNATATATPNPVFNTPTPIPGTIIPTDQRATPMPAGTQYCIPAPTATPPGQYQQTPVPTATPDSAHEWSILDTFMNAVLNNEIWQGIGGVSTTGQVNHSSTGDRSVNINYSAAPPDWDGSVLTRTALVYAPLGGMTGPVYVDGWAQADIVPVGHSAKIEVWYLTDIWHKAGETSISARNWYPFHLIVETGNNPSAIAIVSSRSDNPPGGYIFIDDIYIYGSLAFSPRCDGTYPEGTTSGSGGLNPNITGDGESVLIDGYPSDKPCPTDITKPNNFYGPLISGLTLFFDQITAGLPPHEVGFWRDVVQNTLSSPIGTFAALTGIFIDWTIGFWLLQTALVLEGAHIIITLYLSVKKMIPFLN